MIKCQICGADCNDEATFCNQCGERLEPKKKNRCSNLNCRNASVDLDDNDKYCERCGKPTTYWIETEKNC